MADVRDSINPFPDLPPPPPGGNVTGNEGAMPGPFVAAPPPPPPVVSGGGGKPGWKRVSTRQWIRDFRDHIAKYQTYPYKTVFGVFFWSFGYYPDMVSAESYQKYISKYPPSARKHSTGSGHVQMAPQTASEMTTAQSETSISEAPSKDVLPTDDSNANLVAAAAAAGGGKKKGKKGKGEDEAAPSSRESIDEGTKADGKKGKGKKGKKESVAVDPGDAAAAAPPEAAEGKKGKGKKGKKESVAVDAGDAAAAAPPEAAEGKKGKGKKGKAEPAETPSDTALAPEAAEGGKKGKGKKGKEAGAEAAPAGDEAAGEATGKKGKKGDKKSAKPKVSGNIAFDPEVYDLSSLNVMNLPAGATEDKIKKLFPGSTVKMEGGGATVTFPNAAAAEPFFTKALALDGQSLVVSPKLKI